jgi:hypothetical protein
MTNKGWCIEELINYIFQKLNSNNKQKKWNIEGKVLIYKADR